jgi:hypothetical protein
VSWGLVAVTLVAPWRNSLYWPVRKISPTIDDLSSETASADRPMSPIGLMAYFAPAGSAILQSGHAPPVSAHAITVRLNSALGTGTGSRGFP